VLYGFSAFDAKISPIELEKIATVRCSPDHVQHGRGLRNGYCYFSR